MYPLQTLAHRKASGGGEAAPSPLRSSLPLPRLAPEPCVPDPPLACCLPRPGSLRPGPAPRLLLSGQSCGLHGVVGPCAGCPGVPAALWPQSSAGKAALEGLRVPLLPCPRPPPSWLPRTRLGRTKVPGHREAPFRTGHPERQETGLRFPGAGRRAVRASRGARSEGQGSQGAGARTGSPECWATQGMGKQLGSDSPVSPGAVES